MQAFHIFIKGEELNVHDNIYLLCISYFHKIKMLILRSTTFDEINSMQFSHSELRSCHFICFMQHVKHGIGAYTTVLQYCIFPNKYYKPQCCL